MRRLLVMAAVAMLVLGSVQLVGAATPVAPRHIEGSFVALGDAHSGAFLFEIRANATGRAEFGYYQTEWMKGPADQLPYRTQATVRTVRFFKAGSGAPAAEFTGRECFLAAADPALVGTCPWYHIIVTDGGSLREPDTFCGAQVATECHVWNLTYGDIRIY
jgi:hypothetical protein